MERPTGPETATEGKRATSHISLRASGPHEDRTAPGRSGWGAVDRSITVTSAERMGRG